jgi:hypothetical protein
MKVQSRATSAGNLPVGRTQLLLTIAEIAVVAFPCAVVSAIAGRNMTAGHSGTITGTWRAISVILPAYLLMLVSWGAPLVGGYVYGWKRQRRLTFFVALIGWTVGLLASHLVASAVWTALGFAGIHAPHSAKAHAYHVPVWLSWTMWIVWYAIFSALPSLAAMKGQKRRLAESGVNASRPKARAKG